MGLKPLPAILALLVLGAAALIGGRHMIVNVEPHLICSSRLAVLDEPAADILFVGNSRTGRSIDPVYIQAALERRTGTRLVVERLSPTASMLPRFNALLRDYVQKRGAPGIVVFQLPYADAGVNGGAELRAFARLPFNASPEAIEQVVAEDISPSGASALRNAFHRDGVTAWRIHLARVAAQIYGVVRYPVRLHLGQGHDCTGAMIRMQRGTDVWPYGTLHEGLAPTPKTAAEHAGRDRETARLAKLPLEDPEQPEHRFEAEQIRQIVSMLKTAGSQVLLTTVPRYRQAAMDPAVLAHTRQAYTADFIDPFAQLGPDRIRALQPSFIDNRHFDDAGAKLYSDMWIALLAERLK